MSTNPVVGDVAVPPVVKTEQPKMQFLDLKAQFESIRPEITKAIESVFDSQHFILGKEVQLLEEEIARFVSAPHAVGCASGSDALSLALCALDVGPGDEVITTPMTAPKSSASSPPSSASSPATTPCGSSTATGSAERSSTFRAKHRAAAGSSSAKQLARLRSRAHRRFLAWS